MGELNPDVIAAASDDGIRLTNRYAFEVCVDSVTSLENAVRGGATRIELCQNLYQGGMTPSYGMISLAKNITKEIPLFVLIRPHAGRFQYNNSELATMISDIKNARAMGVDGIVVGALTSDYEIDIPKCQELIKAAGNLPVTFHRAFDLTKDPISALECVIQLGCKRLLTSGCKSNCLDGAPFIQQLVALAGERITIVAGGRIDEFNLAPILDITGVTEFHSSAGAHRLPAIVPVCDQGFAELFGPPYVPCRYHKVVALLNIAKRHWLK